MRSFTLIELIVTIFISSVIILIFCMLLDFTYSSYEYAENSTSYENIGFISSYLTNEINKSQKVYTSNIVKIKPSYYTKNSIILRQNGDGEYKYIYFALNRNTLYKLTQKSKEKDINSGKIQFDNLSGSGVNIIADDIEAFEITYDKDTHKSNLYIQLIDGSSCSTSVYAYGGSQ